MTFAADGEWLIAPGSVRPSTLILLSMVAGGVVAGVLIQFGVVNRTLAGIGAVVRWGVRVGFRAWERGLSWAPWPVFAAVVAGLLTVGVLLAGPLPAVALPFAVVPLLAAVVATLAYMFIDVERYEVARGYKSLHNPMKGQRLAAELVQHGPRVGVPLLAAAAVGMMGGFALLNLALFHLFGPAWYTQPADPPTYLDFVASALVHLLSVVDLLNLLDTHHLVHVVVPRPESGVANAVMAGFKTFFTLVLLQQIFASVRRGKVLAETIADFWSPHSPIHDRARSALPQYGAAALSPLLLSLSRVDSLTQEQRQRLPEILGTVGPAAIPHLLARLTDPNEHVRAVAASALGHLRAGAAVPRIARLCDDPSELVRLSAAEALGEMSRRGWPPPAGRRRREWWKALRFWRKKRTNDADDPTAALLAALRKALADPTAAVRAAAAESLARLGPDTAGELAASLMERTTDEDETVRVRAISAVGVVAADHPDTVSTLAGLLADPSQAVRTAAATALGTLKGKAASAVSALVPLLQDRDETVRTAAADAMGRIGSLPQAAAASLAEGLASEDTVLQARTAEALGSIGEAAADVAPALVLAADDDNDRVRAKAIEALGHIGEAAAPVAVPRLVRALRDPDDWVSALAAEALGEMGGAADVALPALIRSLAHTNSQVRANAAEAIGRLGRVADSAVPALERAAGDTDRGVRLKAVEALGGVGRARPSTTSVLRAALADPDPHLREGAAAAFGALGTVDDGVRAVLLALLDDPNDGVKLRAIQVLPRLVGDGPEVVDGLTRRLTEDDSDRVKAEAARGLGQLGPAAVSAGTALLRAVQTGEVGVREEAMRAMVMVQPPEAAEAFTAGLRDSEVAVRTLASAGWRKAADIPEEAVPALVEALHDPELQVRANAAYAVGRMESVPAEAVPLLAECLLAGDDGLRLHAALALQATAGRAAAETLRPLLDDPNPRLRLIATRRLLTEDPTDPRAADALAAAEGDPSPGVRRAADDLLDALDPAAVPGVLEAVRGRVTSEQNPELADRLTAVAGRLQRLHAAPAERPPPELASAE